MVPLMLVLAWIVAQALAAPTPTCTGADIALQNLRFSTVRGNATTQDRVVITADVVNIGLAAQSGDAHQHVELLRDGKVLANERVRPLRAGERYPVALRIFRPISERKTPLPVIVRYIPDDERARRENCNPANNSIEKIF
jgi:hypothetical protein